MRVLHNCHIILYYILLSPNLPEYCTCMVEVQCNGVLLHISFQLYNQWRHIDSLKSAKVGIFKP